MICISLQANFCYQNEGYLDAAGCKVAVAVAAPSPQDCSVQLQHLAVCNVAVIVDTSSLLMGSHAAQTLGHNTDNTYPGVHNTAKPVSLCFSGK